MIIEICNNKKGTVKLTAQYSDASDTLKIFLAEKSPNPTPSYVTRFNVKLASGGRWVIGNEM